MYTQTRRGGGEGGAVMGEGRRQVNKTFSLSPNFNYKSVRYVRPTEYTQSGTGHFLAYIPSWWKTQPSLVMGGVARPPYFTISPITFKVVVYTLRGQIHSPYFFFPYVYSVVRPLIPIAPLPFCVSGRDWAVRVHPESETQVPLCIGRGIDSRNRVWNWVAKLHRLAGRYDNPVPMRDLSYRLSLSSIIPTLLVFC